MRKTVTSLIFIRAEREPDSTKLKLITFLTVLSVLCGNAAAATKKRTKRPCDPLTGDAVQQEAKDLNRFKNRSQSPGLFDFNPTITIQKILAPGNDGNRFSMATAATITGYVVKVQRGGIETCNCHADKPAKMDTHIDVVADPKYAVQHVVKTRCHDKLIQKDTNEKYHMIVEVTPRVRDQQLAKGIDWSTDTLKQRLTHRWVRFSGWLLFDNQHIREAENTNPGNKCNWRATCTEIHPIFGIRVVDPPRRFANSQQLQPYTSLSLSHELRK
jgi:hypothetical protein